MDKPPAEHQVRIFRAGEFQSDKHFYPRVLNAHIHPLVRFFFQLTNDRIAERFCHLHPEVHRDAVRAVLQQKMRWFRWGGADLFPTTNEQGQRQIVLIETNSCASGQKSMPPVHDNLDQAGYHAMLKRAFLPLLKKRGLPRGGLAVLYDKNEMETSGYAATMADLTDEPVYLVPCFDKVEDRPVRFTADRVLEIRTPDGAWLPIRACFRYVTQRPWNRIPPFTRTEIFNPIAACLAGGRNKMLAAKAYDLYNADLARTGLSIRLPETIWDVQLPEVPLWVQRFGGKAVVKNPYSNAGQGVYTITNQDELDAFMALEHSYDRFIVQALIGNREWSSRSRDGRLYHVGTMPDKKHRIYVADLRFMVASGEDGFFPVAIYARRAAQPLTEELKGDCSSWDMLGTNLSKRRTDGGWDTEDERLLLMDARDFNKVGVGMDDLIEGYLQTVLSLTAIDRMTERLRTKKGNFRMRFFKSLNPDAALAAEICS